MYKGLSYIFRNRIEKNDKHFQIFQLFAFVTVSIFLYLLYFQNSYHSVAANKVFLFVQLAGWLAGWQLLDERFSAVVDYEKTKLLLPTLTAAIVFNYAFSVVRCE